MIVRGLLAGVAAGGVVFFETGHVHMAVGYAVAVGVFVVIGWNLAGNSSAPGGRPTGSARPPLRFREASASTKALTTLGVLLLVPGLWLIRDDQAVLGIPVLMVALVPLLLVRRRVTSVGPGPVGQSHQ
jgi:hypothetical protein